MILVTGGAGFIGYNIVRRLNLMGHQNIIISDELNYKSAEINLKKLNRLELDTQLISDHTSKIAKVKKIRSILKSFQISFSRKYNNCIIEGRDISTEIIPYSDVKFYFICDLENASKRRYQDLKKKNHKVKLSEVKKSIKLRNLRDKNRKHSPLLKHRDALEIHTGKLNRKKMVEKMSKHIEDVMNT